MKIAIGSPTTVGAGARATVGTGAGRKPNPDPGRSGLCLTSKKYSALCGIPNLLDQTNISFVYLPLITCLKIVEMKQNI